VLAYRIDDGKVGSAPRPRMSASSTQAGFSADAVIDGAADTYWVSNSTTPGGGPTPEKPQWIDLNFPRAVKVAGVTVQGRPGYSPKDCELQQSTDGKKFVSIKPITVDNATATTVKFGAVESTHFRLLMTSAFDPKFPDKPRNAQVAEIALLGDDGKPLTWEHRAKPITELAAKAMSGEYGWSATDCTPLLLDIPGEPGETDTLSTAVVDITDHMTPDGTLAWTPPAGTWTVLRFGWTVNGAHVSTASGAWQGLVVDYLDAQALRDYWAAVVEPIIDELGPLAGKSVTGLETDSWEAGGLNWTPAMFAEFKRRRGYDLKPWLPVLAGRIVDDRDKSNRFLADFRKTISDLMADNHYSVLAELAAKHGMTIHCEASGPHTGPFDGLKNLGRCGQPMSEFWAPSPHRSTDLDRFFTKCCSSAAHIYGKQIACAEGFTEIGHDWNDPWWCNLKPTFDHEACAGMNLVYWHAFTCSPASMGVPGQEYFAGTHFDPNITWAAEAPAFVSYLDRCQFMLQQGKPVADVCFYTGDQTPNIVPRKQVDPPGVLPEYDYDEFDEEVLLTRMTVKDGRIVLPDGMSYRVMVLPKIKSMSLAALRKINELVAAGAIVVGPKPDHTESLTDFPNADAELKTTAAALWDTGRVISDKATKQVLAEHGTPPDFSSDAGLKLDFIHRRTADADIYFIRNDKRDVLPAVCSFRVTGRMPELWDAVRGTRIDAAAFRQSDGRTTLPITFPPFGSTFVVFRRPIPADQNGIADRNEVRLSPSGEITGPWTVTFDPNMGGPASVVFDSLVDWTVRPEEGIKHYSGTATYHKTFDLPAGVQPGKQRLFIDLGTVHEIAHVRLNGRDLGAIWCPPWNAEITAAVKPTGNDLEIDVVNFWPNRIIGDAGLPEDQRHTKTNVPMKATDPLLPSGLIGPVTIESGG
jgi:hypothetical protein